MTFSLLKLDCNLHSLGLFRIAIALALLYELSDRAFASDVLDAFYSEDGIWPARIMQERSSSLHVWICPHSWQDGSFTSTLLALQFLAAACLLVGWQTRTAAVLSWLLYNSLTLRNVWLSYIADRYFHILLFFAVLLPCGKQYSLDHAFAKAKTSEVPSGLPLLSILFKLQILWIYFDAGYGKSQDPLQGWSFNASPLPALDTYTRHTTFAIWLYRLLGPYGLRVLTPTVVVAELYAPFAAIVASCLDAPLRLQLGLVCLLPLMHLGIALALVNTVSLSIVASVAWLPFLPAAVFSTSQVSKNSRSKEGATPKEGAAVKRWNPARTGSMQSVRWCWRSTCVLVFWALCVYHEIYEGNACSQSGRSTVPSVLLNNRWNVFIGAETYVTWEISPAKLADGRIVDLWTRGGPVAWDVPSLALVSNNASTTYPWLRRSGRWRSFPYLSVSEGFAMTDEAAATSPLSETTSGSSSCAASPQTTHPVDLVFHDRVWSYLCEEWNRQHETSERVLRFSFFMLQADIEPNLGYSPVRKRLIHSHECHRRT